MRSSVRIPDIEHSSIRMQPPLWRFNRDSPRQSLRSRISIQISIRWPHWNLVNTKEISLHLLDDIDWISTGYYREDAICQSIRCLLIQQYNLFSSDASECEYTKSISKCKPKRTYGKNDAAEEQDDRFEEKEDGGGHVEKELLSGKRRTELVVIANGLFLIRRNSGECVNDRRRSWKPNARKRFRIEFVRTSNLEVSVYYTEYSGRDDD